MSEDIYSEVMKAAIDAIYEERNRLRATNAMLIAALEHIAATDTVSRHWAEGALERARLMDTRKENLPHE